MGRYRENEKDFSFLVYRLRRMVHLAVTGMKFLKYFVFCGMQESYAAVKALAHLGCRLISNSEIQGLSWTDTTFICFSREMLPFTIFHSKTPHSVLKVHNHLAFISCPYFCKGPTSKCCNLDPVFQPLFLSSSKKASVSLSIHLSLCSLFFIFSNILTLSTMVCCGAQVTIKQEWACGVVSLSDSFHCNLTLVWYSQAIGLEVKADEMKEPSRKLGKSSHWTKEGVNM